MPETKPPGGLLPKAVQWRHLTRPHFFACHIVSPFWAPCYISILYCLTSGEARNVLHLFYPCDGSHWIISGAPVLLERALIPRWTIELCHPPFFPMLPVAFERVRQAMLAHCFLGGCAGSAPSTRVGNGIGETEAEPLEDPLTDKLPFSEL